MEQRLYVFPLSTRPAVQFTRENATRRVVDKLGDALNTPTGIFQLEDTVRYLRGASVGKGTSRDSIPCPVDLPDDIVVQRIA